MIMRLYVTQGASDFFKLKYTAAAFTVTSINDRIQRCSDDFDFIFRRTYLFSISVPTERTMLLSYNSCEKTSPICKTN